MKRMVKTVLAFALAVAMALALAACTGGGSSPAANTGNSGAGENAPAVDADAVAVDEHPDWIEMTLIVATFLPEGNPTNACFSALQAKLDKYMPGKITMNVNYAGTLLNEQDTYDGILQGTADIGIVSVSRQVSRFPLSQLFCYPGLSFNGSGCAAEAHWNWIQEEKPAEYDDVIVLMTQATGPMALVTKERVKEIGDVAGKQYRADGVVGETVGAWGGVAVTIEDSETYESLRNGLIQGSYSFYGGSAKNKLDEVAEYVMVAPLTNMAFFFGMNKERFQTMPEDQQAAFLQAADEAQREYTWWFNEENIVTDRDVVAFAQTMKHTMMSADDPAFAAFNDAGKVLQDEYVKKLDADGLDGTGQLAIIKRLSDEANAKMTWEEYLKFYPPDLRYAD